MQVWQVVGVVVFIIFPHSASLGKSIQHALCRRPYTASLWWPLSYIVGVENMPSEIFKGGLVLQKM